MKAAEFIETERLILRRPVEGDAQRVFACFSNDAAVTRYLGWSRHQTVAQARGFLDLSDISWAKWRGGPYVIESRATKEMLGTSGFAFEVPHEAIVGYALAKKAWGQGHATEALTALVNTGREMGLSRLYAHCHPDHGASSHVLEKCGFVLLGRLPQHSVFPNLNNAVPNDVLLYSLRFKIT